MSVQDEETFVQEDEVVEEEMQSDLIKKLRNELKEAKKQRDEYLVGWQKAKAEFINFKKDQEEQRKQLGQFMKDAAINDFIPVLDSYEMARSNKEAWEAVDQNWRVGVEYIFQQLYKILEDYGMQELQPQENEDLDPTQHESVGEVEITQENQQTGKIAQTIRKGYKTKTGVLRTAQVKLFKN